MQRCRGLGAVRRSCSSTQECRLCGLCGKIDDEWVCVVATGGGVPVVSERAWLCAGAHLAVPAAVGRQGRGEDMLSTVSQRPSWLCPYALAPDELPAGRLLTPRL